jgi:hypothetical protein
MRALALAHSHCATALRLQHAIPFISGLLALMKLVVMPCFCMISGHLSPATIEDRHARGLVKVLATSLIFQGLYFAMKVVAFTLAGFGVQKLPIELFNPPQQVVTWFLLALIIWRASLPTMLRTRVPMLISLLLAHGALFADLGVNHQNVLSFWPFFVGGALVPRDAWAQLNRPDVRRPLAASFVTCALSLALFSAYAGQRFPTLTTAPGTSMHVLTTTPALFHRYGGQHFHDAFYQLTRTYACFNGSPPDPSGVKLSECSSMRELWKPRLPVRAPRSQWRRWKPAMRRRGSSWSTTSPIPAPSAPTNAIARAMVESQKKVGRRASSLVLQVAHYGALPLLQEARR